MTALTEEQIAVTLGKVAGWTYEERRLQKSFVQPNLRKAAEFAAEVSKLAEKHRHHPELHLTHTGVTVLLSTESEGGVTGKDFLLAEEIEKLR
ncbi:4a-hydroxytetrahydrobiopterin dehydratase [Gorillibacterium sp. sgz500922]|uniref:4a-hydroxytetrahydrobiopterin dehydratase n=1 Tax=Gorillibacterium sp. sgz500922 TaxID=3446694 RepID=UPI003F670127